MSTSHINSHSSAQDIVSKPPRTRWSKRTNSQATPFSLFIRRFTPQWFLVCMGTGILSLILHENVYQFHGLHIISYVVWGLDIVLFSTIFGLFTTRWLKYTRETWKLFENDVEQTLYFSALNIAMGTIIEIWILVLGSTSHAWSSTLHVFYWIDTVFSILATFFSYWILIRHEHPNIDNLPPTLVYPSVGVITSASVGGVLAKYSLIPDASKVTVIITSYITLGFGLMLSLVMIGSYAMRLLSYQTPSAEKAPAAFTVVAPLGQAAYGVLILGSTAKTYFPMYKPDGEAPGYIYTEDVASALYAASIMLSFLLWGFALFWMLIAIIEFSRDAWKTHYNLYFWSMVYPLGVFGAVAIEWGKEFKSDAFARVGTAMVFVTLIAWLANIFMIVPRIFTGHLRELGFREKPRDEEGHSAPKPEGGLDSGHEEE